MQRVRAREKRLIKEGVLVEKRERFKLFGRKGAVNCLIGNQKKFKGGVKFNRKPVKIARN